MFRRLGPCITFFPQPLTLVASAGPDGRPDLMAASWVGLASKTPPTVAVSLHQGRLSYANICASGSFTVNAVPAHLAAQADFCGLVSGRSQDKWQAAGLTPAAADKVAAPVIAESPLKLECRLSNEVELGDYRLLLGEIVEVQVMETAFRADGTLDPRVINPVVYLGGIREYWDLGRQVGTAYQDGKKFI